MSDTIHDRYSHGDPTAMLQSRAQRPVKQKTTHTCASSIHETCRQDSTSWLSFLSGPAYWTFLSSPFSHRCIEPATAPLLPSPSATDVFTRPASPPHQLPIYAYVVSHPVESFYRNAGQTEDSMPGGTGTRGGGS